MSIGMSLALTPIIGLILNYTPWGIRLTLITLSLLAMTIIFATAAILRQNQQEPRYCDKTSKNLRNPDRVIGTFIFFPPWDYFKWEK
jgi:uncharacterized membrane protein